MLFSFHDVETVSQILREAAQAEILPRFRNLGEGAVRQKSSALDLVTEADEAAERRITQELRRAFPAALVVGEEASERDASLLDGLSQAELAFVVDPVDGTKNFASGLPLFGVMAAAIVRGEVAAGIIYDPIGGDWAVALRGEGAFTTRPDGRRIDLRVAPPVPVHEMSGIASWYFLPDPLRDLVPANLPRVAAAGSYRCAAHEYRMAAAGHCHFLLYAKLMPWDHAAGWLIHREAGGFAARFDGTRYQAAHHRSGGLLCAPDRESWSALREALLGEATDPHEGD